MRYQITVTYTKPMCHGQTQQRFNAETIEQATTKARHEFGKPLVKSVSISVELELWTKTSIQSGEGK